MKKLLVLALVLCCSCSYSFDSFGQMLDEGTTSTTETIANETTTTTTVIKNKTTGDILDSDAGIVATRYEGDMDQDWGGIGSASMPASCEFNTGRCAKGTSSTLTTFQQTVDVSQFHISSGGALSWELDMYHSQNNTTGYFESKGYNDGVLLWETGQVSLANNGSATSYSGNYDYAGALDKVFISIGGSNNYYFDNVNYTLNYNVVTTTVETWLQAVAQEQEINTAIDLINDYQTIESFDQVVVDLPDLPDLTETFVEPTFADTITLQPMENLDPIIETNSFEPEIITMETVTEDIQEVMNIPDIQEQPEVIEASPVEPKIEIETQIVENTPEETVNDEIEQPINAPTEAVEEVEDSKPTPETATNEETTEEVKEEPKEIVQEEVKENDKEESEPEKKEVAKNETKKEQIKETKIETKISKQQQAKEEKAKSIMQSFDSNYDAVAQLTTLALVNALGADIKTYQQIPTQAQPTWYVEEELYGNQVMYDPLGNYFGIKDNLMYENMIGEQYE